MNKYFMLICFLCLGYLPACKKINHSEIDNLSGNRIAIIGHGGLGFPSVENDKPTNTRSGILRAVEGYGVDGIEVDVQMSKDQVLMLYHDEDLSSRTNCEGCVYEQSAKTLTRCRYRKRIGGYLLDKEYLISLESILAHFSQRQQPPIIILDIKTFSPCPLEIDKSVFLRNYAGELYALIDRYKATEWVLLETRSIELIRELQLLTEALKIVLIGRPDAELIDLAEEYKLYGLGFEHEDVSAADVKKLHDRGFRVVLWDVGGRTDAVDAISKSPDFIETENIILLQQILQ